MKKNVPDSKLGRLYSEHIDLILEKDIDGLLNQYAEDALLISTLTPDKTPLYVRGHKELEGFFRSRIFTLADLTTEIAQWAETDEVLMMVEAIAFEGTDGSKGSCRFYDNWVLDENGKIKIHFAGVVQYPDGSIA
jgi:ketosteroid isomerase-like protein